MTAEAKPIKITPDSRVTDLLAEADKGPLVLEQNGVRYRLSREEENLWANYDAEKVQAMLDAIGSWSDLDADALVQDVYRWRREGSRPAISTGMRPPFRAARLPRSQRFGSAGEQGADERIGAPALPGIGGPAAFDHEQSIMLFTDESIK
jgi:hypothetical protein